MPHPATPPDRTVAIAAAGCTGETSEVTARIAARLRGALPDHWDIIHPSISDPAALRRPDAVVLGSTHHDGRWPGEAVTALTHATRRHGQHLSIFSVGRLEGPRTAAGPELPLALTIVGWRAGDYHAVVGTLPYLAPTTAQRVKARASGARAQGRLAWDVLDMWTARLGVQLCALDIPRLAAPRVPASALV